MSQFAPYIGIYDIQVADNGLISHWTTPDGAETLTVYEDGSDRVISKLCKEIDNDIISLLGEWAKEEVLTHFKITLSVENLREKGGAA